MTWVSNCMGFDLDVKFGVTLTLEILIRPIGQIIEGGDTKTGGITLEWTKVRRREFKAELYFYNNY